MVEDQDSLVILLIDEVESLTAARKAAVSGSEPSDAVRVVNAVLTAIDSFRSAKNVRQSGARPHRAPVPSPALLPTPTPTLTAPHPPPCPLPRAGFAADDFECFRGD